MKLRTSVVLFALFAVANFANGQMSTNPYLGTATFFAEEGEAFTLYVNGEKINAQPAPNVVDEEVTTASISIRVVFADGATPELKKTIFRMGKDCTYMIKKNKKGEYGTSMKSCNGQLGPPQSAQPVAVAPVAPIAPAGGGKLSATYTDGIIHISDGRMLTVTKSKTSGGWPSPHVKMNAPTGARVSITYDDNNEKYNTEVPFDYEVKDYNNNNSYFRLTVDEGGPDKTWYVRLQNGTAYQLTIE